MIDETHDGARQSWVASANGHAEFPLQNLPFGVFSPPGTTVPVCAVGAVAKRRRVTLTGSVSTGSASEGEGDPGTTSGAS